MGLRSTKPKPRRVCFDVLSNKPIVLIVDTSTEVQNVVLLRGGVRVASLDCFRYHSHASTLLESIDVLLRSQNLGVDQIHRFVVTLGPGSFTGIRIGASTISGLALHNKAQVVGIGTAEALALSVSGDHPVAVCIDAGRGEAYVGVFETKAQQTISNVIPLSVCSKKDLPQFLTNTVKQNCLVTGSAALRDKDFLRQQLADRFIMNSDFRSNFPTPAGLQRAYELVADQLVPKTAGLLEPFYLKASDAERKTCTEN